MCFSGHRCRKDIWPSKMELCVLSASSYWPRERMLCWIAKIYSNPTAQLKVNRIHSGCFPISNGTRQGCPLSHALSLEQFLCKISLSPDVQRLSIGGIQHKISAYANDLLFSLTNPAISLLKPSFQNVIYTEHSQTWKSISPNQRLWGWRYPTNSTI